MTVKRVIRIHTESGLPGLTAARFVQMATGFLSDIQIRYGELKLNAKSLMGLLWMAPEPGTELLLEAEGQDAEEAVNCLEAFLLTP